MDILELIALTRRLTQKPNVLVSFSSDGKAYVEGNERVYNVHVPLLDDSAEALSLLRGYLDHEVAHVLFTDLPAWNVACNSVTNAERNFINIYEDVRVERLMGLTYPGAKYNLTWLARRLFAGKLAASIGSAATHDFVNGYVTILLLHTQRASLVPELGDGLEEAMAPLTGMGLSSIKPLLGELSQSTADSIRLGKELYKRMLCNASGLDEFVNQMRDYCTKHQSVKLEPTSDLSGDMHTRLSKAMQPHADAQAAGGLVALLDESQEIGCPVTAGYGDLLTDTATLRRISLVSAQVRRTLVPLLQSMQYKPGARGWYGALDGHNLHRLGVGDGRVFVRKSQRVVRQAYVSMLCDCSGSMQDDITDALVGMYAMWEGLSGVPGLHLKCYAFSDCFSDATPVRRGTYAALDANGGTSMGGAILRVLNDFERVGSERRILFVFTDGLPDSVSAAKHAISVANKSGVELYGLGIGDDYLHELLPADRRVTVKNMQTEFAPALQKLMTAALTRALAA